MINIKLDFYRPEMRVLNPGSLVGKMFAERRYCTGREPSGYRAPLRQSQPVHPGAGVVFHCLRHVDWYDEQVLPIIDSQIPSTNRTGTPG
jgi:hypothetical protein